MLQMNDPYPLKLFVGDDADKVHISYAHSGIGGVRYLRIAEDDGALVKQIGIYVGGPFKARTALIEKLQQDGFDVETFDCEGDPYKGLG